MNDNEADGRTYPVAMARQGPGIALQRLHSLSLWNAIRGKAGGIGPVMAVVALAAGILMGTASSQLSNTVTSAASAFIDVYGYGAPVLIFIVLAPALSRIFSTRREGTFGIYVVSWLAVSKVLAMLWAVAFTAVIFGIPLVPDHAVSAGDALSQTVRSLLSTLVGSQFFWAIYVAIATGVVAIRVKPIATLLEKGVSGVEHAGQYLQPLIPAFMFAVGVYVQALPNQLNDQIGLNATATSFQTVEILGLSMDANTTAGMVTIYVVGALLVGVAASVWHVAILALAKLRDPRFSLRDYFTNYWVKAYPLLWSTSSESLATPLNLYILSKRAPYVKPTVRRLVAGAGSVLCTNGTLISVFILLGVVAAILGIRLSLLELLLCIPVAFLISFGIPGIPGELLLFAGPLAVILAIAPEVTLLFLALYLGLQVGLPDSFRTGANSTNNFVYCILLNKTYEDRFMLGEPSAEELEG